MPQKFKYMSDSGVLDNEVDVSDHNQEDTGGEVNAGIALISDGSSVSESCDDTVSNDLDDDFYDPGEFSDEAYSEGATDAGF